MDLNHNPSNGRTHFNTSQFSENALGTPGSARRRFFSGPGWTTGLDNYGTALLKNVRLIESKSLQGVQPIQSCPVLRAPKPSTAISAVPPSDKRWAPIRHALSSWVRSFFLSDASARPQAGRYTGARGFALWFLRPTSGKRVETQLGVHIFLTVVANLKEPCGGIGASQSTIVSYLPVSVRTWPRNVPASKSKI